MKSKKYVTITVEVYDSKKHDYFNSWEINNEADKVSLLWWIDSEGIRIPKDDTGMGEKILQDITKALESVDLEE